jgi:hypothetical protein
MDTALVVVVLTLLALHVGALAGGGLGVAIVRLYGRGRDKASEAKG